MTAKIRLEYDPTKARQGLAEVSVQAQKTGKSLDTMGKEAVGAAKDIDQATVAARAHNKELERTVSQNRAAAAGIETSRSAVGGLGAAARDAAGQFGNLSSVAGALGPALGGAGGEALSLAGSLGGAGVAAGALFAIFESGKTIIGALTDDVKGLSDQTTALGRASDWSSKQIEKIGISVRGQISAVEALEAKDREWEQQQKASFDKQQARLGQAGEARKVFEDFAAQRQRESLDASIRQSAELKTQEGIRRAIAIEEEKSLRFIEQGKSITDETKNIEGLRNELAESYRQTQVRIGALKERQNQLLGEQARKLQEIARQEAENQRAENEAHRARMAQMEVEARKREQFEADRKRVLGEDVAAFRDSLKAKIAMQQASSSAAGMGSSGPASVGGDSAVIRGRSQWPLQFAGGGLASQLMGMQAAAVGSVGYYSSNLGGPGSRDRLRDHRNIPEGMGGMGGGLVAGIDPDTVTGRLVGAANRKDLLDAVSKRRVAEAGATGDEAAGIRRRTFRGSDPVGGNELAKAAQEIALNKAREMEARGSIDQRTLEGFEKSIELDNLQMARIDRLEQQMQAFQAIQEAMTGKARQKAIKAGRGRL